jgi:hypothetical protein
VFSSIAGPVAGKESPRGISGNPFFGSGFVFLSISGFNALTLCICRRLVSSMVRKKWHHGDCISGNLIPAKGRQNKKENSGIPALPPSPLS